MAFWFFLQFFPPPVPVPFLLVQLFYVPPSNLVLCRPFFTPTMNVWVFCFQHTLRFLPHCKGLPLCDFPPFCVFLGVVQVLTFELIHLEPEPSFNLPRFAFCSVFLTGVLCPCCFSKQQLFSGPFSHPIVPKREILFSQPPRYLRVFKTFFPATDPPVMVLFLGLSFFFFLKLFKLMNPTEGTKGPPLGRPPFGIGFYVVLPLWGCLFLLPPIP